MFEAFSRVPAYPLALPVFWGAFAIFAMVIARRLKVFTAANAAGPAGSCDRCPYAYTHELMSCTHELAPMS